MIKLHLTVLFSALLVGTVLPQSSTDAPVNWTTYKIGDHRLSISFPKLPIRFESKDGCNEKSTEYFFAYAEEVIYTLTVVKKEKATFPSYYCPSKSKFGVKSLNARRAVLEQAGEKASTTGEPELWTSKAGNREVKVWIFDDLTNDRWIELSITGRGDFPRAESYVRSLNLSADQGGIEVGDGSPQMLGDRDVDTNVTPPSSAQQKTDQSEPLTIISKLKAQYTEAARSNGLQGTVTLRVSFLASGGIGSIQVIKGLKYGLTEQAIAAVKKMVFLPEKRNGVAVTTSRPVSFAFNIY